MIKLIIKILSTLITLVLLAVFIIYYIIPRISKYEDKQSVNTDETHFVKRVVDGDTFELENKERVRVLGIDTPEKYESEKLEKDAERTGRDKKTIQRLGKLASDHAKELIEGKKVNLIPEPNYDDKDVYGRLLRYVYLEDGTFFNKKMIEDGYAYAFRKYPISKLDAFVQAENDARINKRGLWGDINGLKQLDSGENNRNTKGNSKSKNKN